MVSERAAVPVTPGAAMLVLDDPEALAEKLLPAADAALRALATDDDMVVGSDTAGGGAREARPVTLAGGGRPLAPPPKPRDLASSPQARLPVFMAREPLLRRLKGSQFVLLEGGTGSGKTTQVPQYLLDAALEECTLVSAGAGAKAAIADKRPFKVLVAQPRRLAAVAAAHRVAFERGEALGESVGYSVHLDKRPPRANAGGSIEFVTAGVLLRRLANDPTLADADCIIVDEVRNSQMVVYVTYPFRRGDYKRPFTCPFPTFLFFLSLNDF